MAPEYTGPLYPEARTILSEQIMPAIINDARPAAEALAEAQSLTEAQQ